MNLYNMIIGYEPSWEKSADSHWEKTVFDLKTLYHEPFDTNPAYRYLQIHRGQNCFGFEMVLIEPLDMYSMYNCTCTYYRFPVVPTVFIFEENLKFIKKMSTDAPFILSDTVYEC